MDLIHLHRPYLHELTFYIALTVILYHAGKNQLRVRRHALAGRHIRSRKKGPKSRSKREDESSDESSGTDGAALRTSRSPLTAGRDDGSVGLQLANPLRWSSRKRATPTPFAGQLLGDDVDVAMRCIDDPHSGGVTRHQIKKQHIDQAPQQCRH